MTYEIPLFNYTIWVKNCIFSSIKWMYFTEQGHKKRLIEEMLK